MSRSDEPLFEPRIADWLEDDPHTAPDQALDVVLAAFPSIKQRRAWRVPWRVPGMATPLRLGLTAAAVGALAIGSLLFVNRGPSGPGGPGVPTPSPAPAASPSPPPSASPSAALADPSTWPTYESARYGFSIGRPTDWTENRADHDWTFENDIEAWLSTGVESFDNPEGSVRTSAWSVAVTPGTTVESWMEAYCTAQNAGTCTGYAAGAVDAETGDQHPGRLVFGPSLDTMAFFLDGQTMYIVAVWREESDPSVMPYGGARRLLEAFLSTMVLGAPVAPSAQPS